MTDADLLERFAAARRRMNLHAAYPTEQMEICRYCGKRWIKYAGTMMDGHGGCFVTEQFRAELADHVFGATAPVDAAAAVLGVSPSVIRLWVNGHKKHAALMARIRSAALPDQYPIAT